MSSYSMNESTRNTTRYVTNDVNNLINAVLSLSAEIRMKVCEDIAHDYRMSMMGQPIRPYHPRVIKEHQPLWDEGEVIKLTEWIQRKVKTGSRTALRYGDSEQAITLEGRRWHSACLKVPIMRPRTMTAEEKAEQKKYKTYGRSYMYVDERAALQLARALILYVIDNSADSYGMSDILQLRQKYMKETISGYADELATAIASQHFIRVSTLPRPKGPKLTDADRGERAMDIMDRAKRRMRSLLTVGMDRYYYTVRKERDRIEVQHNKLIKLGFASDGPVKISEMLMDIATEMKRRGN